MPTLVAFHAHPDDESLLTAGTMAKVAASGHRVVLVLATHGEAGEVAADFLAGRSLGAHDLGTQREREAAASVEAIGADRLVFLGYGDSGVDAGRPDGFSHVLVDDAAARLAAVLREEQADVVTTYDPNGGYGHPDHRHVHRVGQRAAALAGTPVVLEATFNRDLLTMASELVPTLGLELPDDFVPPDTSTWFVDPSDITHTVDVRDFLEHKRASMRAHASQTTSASSTTRSLEMFLSLPDDWFALAFGTEWFVDRQALGAGFDDVFAGLADRST